MVFSNWRKSKEVKILTFGNFSDMKLSDLEPVRHRLASFFYNMELHKIYG